MYINPVSFKIYNRNNNSKQNCNRLNNYPQKFGKVADTVSFSVKKNVFEENLDIVDSIINEDILPFIDDESKNLYIQTGKMGYALQETLRVFSNHETSIFNSKLNILNSNDSKLKSSKFFKYIKTYEDFKDNQKTFERLSAMAQIPMYGNNLKLKNKINSSKHLFNDDNEIKLLEPMVQKYNAEISKLGNELESLTLKNTNKAMFSLIRPINDNLTTSIYYIMINPYGDFQKLIKKRENVKELVKDNKVSPYERLKHIEMLNHDANSIVRVIPSYSKNKNEIKNFIEKTAGFVDNLPQKDEINSAYTKIKDKIDMAADKTLAVLNDYFDKEYRENGVVIDFHKLEKSLKIQQSAINELSMLMD